MTIEQFISNPELKEKFVLQKLICHFLNLNKEEFRLKIGTDIEDELREKITSAYNGIVVDQKPLEYVVWYVEFFGNKFHVNENTLIPRPETEYMITAVTEHCQSLKDQKDNVLIDVGTWSWVLGISVLMQNQWYFDKAIFTEISQKALDVAQQNYEILIKDHDFHHEFLQADLLDFCDQPRCNMWDKNIIIVSNLPYIPEDTFEKNVSDNVKKREPKMAFVWWEDWLDYYRIMLDQIVSLWLLETKSITQFLEMMTRQIDILRAEYQEKFIFEEVKTFHFNIRIVKVTKK